MEANISFYEREGEMMMMLKRRRKRSNKCTASIASLIVLLSFSLSTLWILLRLAPTLLLTPPPPPHEKLLHTPSHPPTQPPPLPPVGQFMLSFLAPDLPFTIFLPTQHSFQTLATALCNNSSPSTTAPDLASNSSASGSSLASVLNCHHDPDAAFAVLSRILGFSAVPKYILSGMVPREGALRLESLSGHGLFLSRQQDGLLLVNGMFCEQTNIIRGRIVIHIVEGIIVDAEFEQSLNLGNDKTDDEGAETKMLGATDR